MKIPRAYQDMLTTLFEAGGSGSVDVYGRVMLSKPGQLPSAMHGDQAAWLTLVAGGYIGGENGKIMLTELGRDTARTILTGYSREAS